MLYTREIIKKLWDAQGYGNLAVWQDGTTRVIAPGEDAGQPLVVLKPMPLVGEFSLLDFALHDAGLLEKVEAAVREAGGEIEREE
ncbi:hypothetical protein ABH15_07730 [Methanoculleus taiwanensis]|uniref:Uncharacterized protein n=1 Tax=Methanoculleus taiwanensis TaxID=1550565 RepID=A0A498H132_9EURY|nr:hypothetical protein [Methanoculleus taiwanensis]RXE56067.1 hypothetical protein ABH15_07730 [Methanoculleus taiwanensis]